MALKLKRGADADRLNYTPQEGELIYTTDNKQIFVGDGITPGGNPASGGGVVAGLSIPASDPYYADAQANPNDPFLDGDLHLRGHNIVGTGDINIDGTITATGNINIGDGGGDTVNFAAGIASNINPTTALTYDLGSASLSWNNIYAGRLEVGAVVAALDVTTAGSFKGNVTGADTTLLVDYDNSNIPGSAISGTVAANLTGNVTGNVTGNLNGNVTLDTMYGLDGTTVIIDGDIANNPDGVAVFTGEFSGLLVGDSEGSHAGPVTNIAATQTALDPDGGIITPGVGIITVGEGIINTFQADSISGAGLASMNISHAPGINIQASAGDLLIEGIGFSLNDGGTGTLISDATNGIQFSGVVDFSNADLTTTAVTFGTVTTGNLTIGGNLTATGNIAATTADTLATPRTINGVAFDGSANISIEDNTKLPTSGAIPMLGDLTLANSTPTNTLHAVSKGYVDAKFFDPTVNTTVSATQTTFTGAILTSEIQEETTGGGLAISSVNGNIAINAGTGTVGIQSIAGGAVTVSGIDITGTSIAASDSSNITVDNITTFLSDVNVDGRMTVAELDATTINTSGAGVPRLESDTNLEISVVNKVNIIDGLFNLGAYTASGLAADFTPADGDIAFVEDSTVPQPHVYTAGMWMPMLSPTIGWTLGANGTTDFTFTGPGFTGTVNDPAFTVYRGHTYVFDNSANGATHPFNLQTSDPSVAGYSAGDLYTAGTSGDNEGVYVWTVPMDAPSTLYYVCTNHGSAMYGTITVA